MLLNFGPLPTPCHTMSLRRLPPSRGVTMFMDGPVVLCTIDVMYETLKQRKILSDGYLYKELIIY